VDENMLRSGIEPLFILKFIEAIAAAGGKFYLSTVARMPG
jgi:hypothetical protein